LRGTPLTGGGYVALHEKLRAPPRPGLQSPKLRIRIHSTDGLALTAVGPGAVPLSIGPVLGGYDTGTPLLTGYFPHTRKGEPRVEGYSLTGIDLLFQWEFKGR
jgi:hypothetical protein